MKFQARGNPVTLQRSRNLERIGSIWRGWLATSSSSSASSSPFSSRSIGRLIGPANFIVAETRLAISRDEKQEMAAESHLSSPASYVARLSALTPRVIRDFAAPQQRLLFLHRDLTDGPREACERCESATASLIIEHWKVLTQGGKERIRTNRVLLGYVRSIQWRFLRLGIGI